MFKKRKHELINQWKLKNQTTSIKQFCREYGLNELTFNDWLNDGAFYVAAHFALKKHLYPQFTKAIHFAEYIESICDEPRNISKKILSLIEKQNGTPLRSVIFVDCDNQTKYLGLLHEMNMHRRGELIDHYFVLCFTRSSFSELLFGLVEEYPFVSLLRSNTNAKDAADVLLTTCAILLHAQLSDMTQIEFNLVSADAFIEELHSQLKNMARSTTLYTSLQESMKNILHLDNNIQDNNIQELEIQKDVKKPINLKLPSESVTTNKDSVQFYIDYYKANWKSTQAAFCRTYGIDSSNFSKWLRGKRSSPASLNAVKQFMYEREQEI
jgi:hypothetical protein